MILAFTDYPITRLGDKEGGVAPVRRCTILSYDGDKYCRVKIGRLVESIKSGYLYSRAGYYGQAPGISHRQLDRLHRAGK